MVVIASFRLGDGGLAANVAGIAVCVVAGLAIGSFNAVLVRVLGVNPIVASLASLSIIQGVAAILRPEPGGVIGTGFTNAVNAQIGTVPVLFIVLVVVMVACELGRTLTFGGLVLQAVGLDEVAARRMGVSVDAVNTSPAPCRPSSRGSSSPPRSAWARTTPAWTSRSRR
jgi:ribose transport system ATP-binding protein